MNIKLLIVICFFPLTSCITKNTDMEVCFNHIQRRINQDSILEKLKYSPVDSCLPFLSLIHKTILDDSKSDSICPKFVQEYFSKNSGNSNTVNNLILFQQFQAYLKHQRFNQLTARDSALKYEKKLKFW